MKDTWVVLDTSPQLHKITSCLVFLGCRYCLPQSLGSTSLFRRKVKIWPSNASGGKRLRLPSGILARGQNTARLCRLDVRTRVRGSLISPRLSLAKGPGITLSPHGACGGVILFGYLCASSSSPDKCLEQHRGGRVLLRQRGSSCFSILLCTCRTDAWLRGEGKKQPLPSYGLLTTTLN